MRKSIFDLERRFDFDDEFEKLNEYLNLNIFYFDYDEISFWNICERKFKSWPYRNSSLSVMQYFAAINIDLGFEEWTHSYTFAKTLNFDSKLLILEFIWNHIYWFGLKESVSFKANKEQFDVILKNIAIILENNNYKIEKIDDHYLIIKRDADLDSVLPIVADEENVRIALLSYMDLRNKKDIEAKKQILKIIADYMEPQRKEFDNLSPSLSSDVFYVFNHLSIRHNNKHQIELSPTEQLEWYDRTFKLALHLIREKELKQYREEIKKIKAGTNA